MKIPEVVAPANVGAYYGNEENGQWQPNGVIIDSGVGGGVVGSGDAGVHRQPVYPVHIPRGHIPGYVMGAYYPPAYQPAPPPAPQDDFADYMWMENEEEFDKQVMQQLEEEALMEQCIEAMLEDEQRERRGPTTNGHNNPTTSNGISSLSLEETVSRSTLNPLAAEFVPTRRPPPLPQPQTPPHTEDNHEAADTHAAETSSSIEDPQCVKEKPATVSNDADVKKEVIETTVTEVTPAPSEPPEVSAADVQPVDKVLDKRPKDMKKDAKKIVKQDPKKIKPMTVTAKSETKVQTPVKKKEVKQVKSEIKLERAEDKPQAAASEEAAPTTTIVSEPVKQTSPPPEEVVLSGPKPINYAAAAKANKPKKPSSPPIHEKSASPPFKNEKITPVAVKPEKKAPFKAGAKEKPVARKNSTK